MTYDQFGEPEPGDPVEVSDEWPDVNAPHTCDKGWIDREADQPRPCLICRPHLAPGRRVRLGQQ